MKYLIESKGKIIILSSISHHYVTSGLDKFEDFFFPNRMTSNSFVQYGCSKLFNMLNSLQIHKLYHSKGVRCNSVHPGIISTGIVKEEFGLVYKFLAPIIEPTFFKNVFEGSQTTLYVASSPEVEEISGKYFQDNQMKSTSTAGQDEELAQKLWDYSESLCKKHLDIEFN
jgi:NAD(P)-dependent dehydrogenase (short-subunit alcohol dehydrogenase family)